MTEQYQWACAYERFLACLSVWVGLAMVAADPAVGYLAGFLESGGIPREVFSVAATGSGLAILWLTRKMTPTRMRARAMLSCVAFGYWIAGATAFLIAGKYLGGLIWAAFALLELFVYWTLQTVALWTPRAL